MEHCCVLSDLRFFLKRIRKRRDHRNFFNTSFCPDKIRISEPCDAFQNSDDNFFGNLFDLDAFDRLALSECSRLYEMAGNYRDALFRTFSYRRYFWNLETCGYRRP